MSSTARPDRCKECGLLKVYGDAYESRVIDQAGRLMGARDPITWVRALVALRRECKRLGWWHRVGDNIRSSTVDHGDRGKTTTTAKGLAP